MTFAIRPATRHDISAIAFVMRESLRELGAAVYDRTQVGSSIEYVGRPDEQLIDDGTYFVVLDGAKIVGCGGWSRRKKAYSGSSHSADDDALLDPSRDAAHIRAMFVLPQCARRGIGRQILERCEQRAEADGFRRLELVALRSGEEMYLRCGYAPVAQSPVLLEDGVILECTLMEKALTASSR
ncbi:MAG: GNAT family N-acetyltransferase [Acidobacteriota bacterium]|nr:GNAT family N-acetyltransferase [Acidobacteriota bacterium]